MREVVKTILSRYGQDIVIERSEEQETFRGIFQHTGSRDWHNMEKVCFPLGQIPRGQYMMLAPAGVALESGNKIWADGRRFAIRRVEQIKWQEALLYSWALCVELGREDIWPA